MNNAKGLNRGREQERKEEGVNEGTQFSVDY